MTKLYEVAEQDKESGMISIYLRTLDVLKAANLVEKLHSISDDYAEVGIIETEMDRPVYILDVKFKGSASVMENVVEVGNPEEDEALNEAIIHRKLQIA